LAVSLELLTKWLLIHSIQPPLNKHLTSKLINNPRGYGQELEALLVRQVHPVAAIEVHLSALLEQDGNMPQPRLLGRDLFRHQLRPILRPTIINKDTEMLE
jgi:hypothetical protein